MRRKSIAGIMALITVSVVFILCLTGCSNNPAVFTEPDLAKTAEVKTYVNDNGVYTYEADFGEEISFNTVVLKEKTDRVRQFKMYKRTIDSWELFYEQDRIDKYRLCAFEDTVSDGLRIELCETDGKTSLSSVEIYDMQEKDRGDFTVSNYITMDGIDERYEDIVQYSAITTDWIIIGSVGLNKDCVFFDGDQTKEAEFARRLGVLKQAIAESQPITGIKAKIVVSIGVTQKYEENENYNVTTANWINDNIDIISAKIKEFTIKYEIDGVDFDWEYPQNGRQWRAYDNLIISVADAVSPLGKYVTIAVAPWGCGLSRKACERIEYVNLMAYDMFDERGDHASIYDTGKGAIDKFISVSNFDKEQVLLGLSFYGRATDKNGDAWPSWTDSGEKLGKFGNYLSEYTYRDAEGNEKTCSAYINGFAMNRDKTAYAISSGIRGIMIFRAKCDSSYDYDYSLHKAVREVLEQRFR